MPAREIISPELHVLGTSKVTISTATTTSFDFGTPNDIDLASVVSTEPGYTYVHGDRVLVILTASTAGTTDSLTWVIQDADDNAGDIGTPATAVTTGTLAVTTGDAFSQISVKLQSGRPWLRVRVTSSGSTDTFVCHCTVLGVPGVL
jgi:hypothetical protein